MPLHSKTLRSMRSDRRSSGESAVRVADQGADWCVRESCREWLLGPGGPDWFSLENEEGAERVKLGHSRVVWRVHVLGHTVFAKVAASTMRSALARLVVMGFCTATCFSALRASIAMRSWVS